MVLIRTDEISGGSKETPPPYTAETLQAVPVLCLLKPLEESTTSIFPIVPKLQLTLLDHELLQDWRMEEWRLNLKMTTDTMHNMPRPALFFPFGIWIRLHFLQLEVNERQALK